MIAVRLGDPKLSAKPTILAIGAHADDIEIGCGGTLLRLAERYPEADVVWVVLSGDGDRGDEAGGARRTSSRRYASSKGRRRRAFATDSSRTPASP